MLHAEGLSPLARGNPCRARRGLMCCGPIPARTGQPYHPLQVKPWMRAYPRSHGATTNRFYSWFNYRGLSPLARGNPVEHVGRLKSPGPIPARTGQPCRRCGAASPLGAYPRSHGATTAKSWPTRTARGLSPLARGNLPSFDHARCNHGPIPARTGQPRRGHFRPPQKRAYPRSHGATQVSPGGSGSPVGLSPLARGNRHRPFPSPMR